MTNVNKLLFSTILLSVTLSAQDCKCPNQLSGLYLTNQPVPQKVVKKKKPLSEDIGKWYVGVGVHSGTGVRSNGTYDIDMDTKSTYVKIGKINDKLDRSEFVINRLQYKNGGTLDSTGIEYHYVDTIEALRNEYLNPYILSSLGLYKFSSGSGTGFEFGLGLGAIANLPYKIELDASYDYKYILSSSDTTSDSYLDGFHGFNVSLNYKF